MKKSVTIILLVLMLTGSAFSQAKVDYRAYQSPVKNQVNRGTCTAFSILAAMETFPGFPTDLSEQYIYGMAKSRHYQKMQTYSEGAFLKFYLDILQTDGTLREDQEPYNPNSVVWNENESGFEKMKKDLAGTSLVDLLLIPDFVFKLQPQMYTYKSGSESQHIDWIKSMLDKGVRAIPVSYSVNGKYWISHQGNRDKKMTPADFLTISDESGNYGFAVAKLKYGENGLFQKLASGALEAYYTDTIYEAKDGHAVAIVGYDENGFLIKNSWGTDWGNKGYGWVSFDYHRIFASEALVLHLGKVHVFDQTFKESSNWNKSEFWIKTLPRDYDNDILNMHTKSISLSIVYHGTAQMPRFDEIEINSFDNNGNLIGTNYGSCHGIFDGRETGYETYILQKDASSYPSANKVVIKFKTVKGETFTNTYYNVVAENKEYKPSLF